ncbi:MAG TPA: VOC family protein [Gemmatimonadaceae bacterium]|nr:VOC family protein [Gemmatimonadaceae bacterium]
MTDPSIDTDKETRSGVEAADYGIRPPGYRLPVDARPGRVSLQVSDLARSLDYYRSTVGLTVLSQAGPSATLGTEGSEVPLVELHERPGASPVPRRGRLGLFHFAILVPNRSALGLLVRHLDEVGEPAWRSDHAVSEAIYLQDPDNLGIEVYADRPRENWRRVDRELYMTTQPLDVGDLVQAAGDSRWSGLPAGTTIGHVHLHVGDLERAAEFYHEGLGLDKVVWSYPGALFLSAGGYHHHLGTNTWASGAAPAGEAEARLLDWELGLPTADDVAAAAGNLARRGHALTGEGADAVARDPWGTSVRLRAAT